MPKSAEVAGAKASPTKPQPRSAFYRVVWRWHFFAGLFVIPVVVILCLSGIVWLFRAQIDDIAYAGLRKVDPGAKSVSYEEQLSAVRNTYPKASVIAVGPPVAANRSTQFDIETADGSSLSAYVNPYTGQVLGARDNDKNIPQLMLTMHGSLLTGELFGDPGRETWGDRFIEIVTGWAIVLLITGIILWWPRGRTKPLRDAFRIRNSRKGARTFWRDLHAVTGVSFAFITLFFLITGMAWTGVWGTKFSEITADAGASYPPGYWDGKESKKVADLPNQGKAPWAMGTIPLRPSEVGADGGGHTHHHGSDPLQWNPAEAAPLDAIVGRAQQMGFDPGYVVYFPGDAKGSYNVFTAPDVEPKPQTSATDGRNAFIDQYTAKPLQDMSWSQFGPAAKAFEFGIALHEGREFGIWNQILTLIGTLAILLSCASSVVMWRKRKPKSLGAPTKPPGRKETLAVIGIVAVLGVLFPLLGITLAVALVFEFLLIRRVPALARAFGSV